MAESAQEIYDEWNKNPERIEKFKTSDAAVKVLHWRYIHITDPTREACAKDTGLSKEEVAEWWDGIDYCFAANGGAHIHFNSSLKGFEWETAIRDFIVKCTENCHLPLSRNH